MNAHEEPLPARTVRLFRNGRSQAVRIPKEFEFEGNEVVITQQSANRLVIEQRRLKQAKTIGEFISRLREIGPIENFPGDPGEEGLPSLDEPKF